MTCACPVPSPGLPLPAFPGRCPRPRLGCGGHPQIVPGRWPSVPITVQVLRQHSRACASGSGVFSSGLALLPFVGALVPCPNGSELRFPCLDSEEGIVTPAGSRWSVPLFEHLVQSRCPRNAGAYSCRWETGAGTLAFLVRAGGGAFPALSGVFGFLGVSFKSQTWSGACSGSSRETSRQSA